MSDEPVIPQGPLGRNPDAPPISTAEALFTESMAQWKGIIDPIIAACTGLRQQLIADGWPEDWSAQVAGMQMQQWFAKVQGGIQGAEA